jgi:ribose transport system substrate-binding protein
VVRLENKRYRSAFQRRRVRLGYVAPLSGTLFREELLGGLRRASQAAKAELLEFDNLENDAKAALRHAEELIKARADVVLMFEPIERIGHLVADRFFDASIPFITIEIPIQGGVYFGANNFRAGRMAGQTLGSFARTRWQGRFDRVVLLESSSSASTNVQARLAGVVVGLEEKVGAVQDSRLVHLDGYLHEESGHRAVADLLARTRPRTRLLISCFNDNTAKGALEAVREAGRENDVAIVGQNGLESRPELRKPTSALIASIAYFPERYGEKLVALARAIVNHERVPPTTYTEHVVLDHRNIATYYPHG